MSAAPHPPARGELEQLHTPIAEPEAVNARLREALGAREELAAAELAARDAQIGVLAAQVGELCGAGLFARNERGEVLAW